MGHLGSPIISIEILSPTHVVSCAKKQVIIWDAKTAAPLQELRAEGAIFKLVPYFQGLISVDPQTLKKWPNGRYVLTKANSSESYAVTRSYSPPRSVLSNSFDSARSDSPNLPEGTDSQTEDGTIKKRSASHREPRLKKSGSRRQAPIRRSVASEPRSKPNDISSSNSSNTFSTPPNRIRSSSEQAKKRERPTSGPMFSPQRTLSNT